MKKFNREILYQKMQDKGLDSYELAMTLRGAVNDHNEGVEKSDISYINVKPSSSLVYNWLSGTIESPSEMYMKLLAKVFECEVEDFYTESEE